MSLRPADITLITICRNAAATLPRTLESVLHESALPGEYLLVDGGSSDGTQEVLRDYAPRFRQAGVAFQCLHQPPPPPDVAGIPAAWNQAIDQAHGQAILLLNADDWHEPTALEELAHAFGEDGEGIEAVAAPVAMRNDSGEIAWLFRPRPWWQLGWRMMLPHPGCIWRKSAYERIGQYNTAYRISADYDFLWRCRRDGMKWRFLQGPPLVNMQLGGAADHNRRQARHETYQIARRHAAWYNPLPHLAFLLRAATGR